MTARPTLRRLLSGATQLALLGLSLLIALPALAHKASDSYLQLAVDGRVVNGQWDIALRDVDFALGLDADGNGEISWGEVRTRHADVAAWALERLVIERGGSCSLRVTDHLVDTHTDGSYTVLKLAGDCPRADGELRLRYDLLFKLDALHRGLLRLDFDGGAHSAVFAPERREQHFVAGQASRLEQFSQYLGEGIWHIWIGYDHILFLLALLLPAVLVHAGGRWHGVARFRDALHEVVWVVTAFTVAHSITLSLAALEVVELPSRLVESAIAASVVLAAANNLKPLVEQRRWLVAFVFGLIHGFGFASVLAELGLPPQALLLSLLAFNLGVELGQLAIVAVFLPLVFALRETAFYRRGVFVGGSLLTLAVALVWLIERAFAVQLIGG